MKTTLNIDEKISQLKKELNELIVRKFVDELTFEDIVLQKQIHSRTKISYTKMCVRIPKCRVNKIDETKDNRIWVYLGKTSEIDLMLFHVSYRVGLLNLMKENIMNKLNLEV